MREIKFRAKVNKSYVYSDSFINLAFYFDATKNYEQEEFTGLKDRKGVDIYERDILSWGEEYNREVVEFKNGCFGYDSTFEFVTLAENNMHMTEVIGNIHENTELL